MPLMLPRRLAAVLLAGVLAVGSLAGCSVNPATGQQSFTLLSPDDERELGAQEHPKILEAFGGAYDDPEIAAYVEGIGQILVANSEQSALPFTFTVIDTPTVNAFALPGGYVYVTRGLMALAASEAELAGVIGHEIGHVTARHGAQQHGRGVVVGVLGVLGAIFGGRTAADAVSLGGGLILRGYSREQEFEADSLGLRYMSRAGYDPDAMASFLARLRDKTKLDAELAGSDYDPDQTNLLATHPRTVDRVQEARAAAIGTGPAEGRIEHEEYMRQLDGMIFDDSPAQGFVRGRRFVHPVMRFEFTVPPELTLNNGPSSVTAKAPSGAVMVFDSARSEDRGSMRDYLRQWGAQLRLTDVTPFTVSGLEAATGLARVALRGGGAMDIRLVAIRGTDGRVYRFLFATPPGETARMAESIQRAVYSFRLLTEAEAAQEKPYRLRIYQARAGDTVARLAQWMPEGPLPEARFRVLNGLGPTEEPKPGQLLKYVSY